MRKEPSLSPSGGFFVREPRVGLFFARFSSILKVFHKFRGE